jgi:hypothetical protein
MLWTAAGRSEHNYGASWIRGLLKFIRSGTGFSIISEESGAGARGILGNYRKPVPYSIKSQSPLFQETPDVPFGKKRTEQK